MPDVSPARWTARSGIGASRGPGLEAALAKLLTDRRIGQTVQTDVGPGTVWFTPSHAAFLRQAAAHGHRPVIVSGEFTELSEPMRQALRYHRGGWAVEDRWGEWRNGLTGRRLARPDQSVDLARAATLDDLASAHIRPDRSDCAHLMVSATARHRPGAAPLPGEMVELLMTAWDTATGRDDLANWTFGQTEPARRAWDAAELDRLAARDFNAGKRHSAFMIAGSPVAPASMTLVVQRYAGFIFEHVTGLISLGLMGEPSLRGRLATLDQVMRSLTAAAGITFALMMVRAGNRALTQPPVLPGAPIPLSILLGSSLVEGLEIDPRQAYDQFQASPVLDGRGLMVLLDAASGARPQLSDLFDSLDFYRASPRMGISPQQLQTLHYVAAAGERGRD
ncbi:MAG: DUF6177 family protein [Bifidobacteriaceae bacterium]|nr:DUF6177 family protein [Bifidobacteriaceae bacterium]